MRSRPQKKGRFEVPRACRGLLPGLLLLVSLFMPPRGFTQGPDPAGPPERRMEAGSNEEPFDSEIATVPDPFTSYLVRRQEELQRIEDAKRQKRSSEIEAKKHQRQVAEEALKAMKEPRTELQQYDLSQLTLSAIVQGEGNSWALVSDPKGMGYVLKPGTAVGRNGGVVDRIYRRAEKTSFGKVFEKGVSVKEPYLLDEEVTIRYKIVEMKLPEEPGL